MSDTSAGRLAFVKETVAGVAPATPAFKVLDFVDEDLVMTAANVRSAAVKPQRVVGKSRRSSREVGGGFRFELYKATEVDEIMAALMGNAFAGSPLMAKAGGPTVDTFTFERMLTATDYRRFSGVRIGSAEFTIQPEQNIMVRVAGVGYTMTTAAAIITDATYAAVTDTEKLNALDVTQITLSNGITTALDYESLSFTVNNQLAARKRIGPNPVRGIGAGQALVTGTANVYVPDKSIADAFVADTHFDMEVPMLFGAAGYTATFQNVQILNYNDPNTGNGNEFMGSIEFEATLDATFASSFGISKTS